jgi:hypothetical protein
VSFEGEITEIEKTAASGNTIRRGFCPKCGSQMYSRTVAGTKLPMRIRAGTLDDPELMAPQAAIWTDSAPSWAQINPDIPHFPKQPVLPPSE